MTQYLMYSFAKSLFFKVLVKFHDRYVFSLPSKYSLWDAFPD